MCVALVDVGESENEMSGTGDERRKNGVQQVSTGTNLPLGQFRTLQQV